VQSLTRANSYFIDTTYAAGLCECFDPAHPLTRADDLKWKQAISDYAREVFGVFGSECGREWAIPHSDFFEGLTGVGGTYYHDKNLLPKVGGTVVPLFELVYRDTIAMYGKYGYDPKRAAEYVLHHLLIGRPLHYHNVPAHLYWKASKPDSSTDLATNAAVFVRGDGGWTDGLHPFDRFVKNTHEILSPLNEITATLPMTRHEFVTRDPTVQRTVFGTGKKAVTVVVNRGPGDWTVASELGGEVRLPAYGFLVESPEFVAFHATRWGGRNHDVSTLFTLRSLDGRSLAKSRRVRIYHGFGPGELVLQGQTLNVGRGTTWTGLPR
jgi:hypothetical protein